MNRNTNAAKFAQQERLVRTTGLSTECNEDAKYVLDAGVFTRGCGANGRGHGAGNRLGEKRKEYDVQTAENICYGYLPPLDERSLLNRVARECCRVNEGGRMNVTGQTSQECGTQTAVHDRGFSVGLSTGRSGYTDSKQDHVDSQNGETILEQVLAECLLATTRTSGHSTVSSIGPASGTRDKTGLATPASERDSPTANIRDDCPRLGGAFHTITNIVDDCPQLGDAFHTTTNIVDDCPQLGDAFHTTTNIVDDCPQLGDAFHITTNIVDDCPQTGDEFHTTTNIVDDCPQLGDEFHITTDGSELVHRAHTKWDCTHADAWRFSVMPDGRSAPQKRRREGGKRCLDDRRKPVVTRHSSRRNAAYGNVLINSRAALRNYTRREEGDNAT